jgi:membrane protease subunit (stomatin/prohibitin family)
MALIDVVKYQSNEEVFAWKFPSDDLRIGTQLIVNTAQTAFFVKGGIIYDQFPPGTYTISTQNIPFLNKVLNLPFGKKSPFKAEIWFVNLINILDCKWGTITSIHLEDPKYGIIVSIKAYGQYGMKICRPKIFLETLVGNMTSYSVSKVMEYFKGKIISSLTNLITQKIVLENISILEINAHLDSLSTYCQETLNFKSFGVDIVNFYFMSINFSEEDESIKKLKEAKDLAARIKIMGKDVYQMDKSFDVLEKAAQNEGMSSTFVGAGVGMGVGMGIGNQMGNMSNMINTNPQTPPPPPVSTYFVYLDNQQSGPYEINDLHRLIIEGKINRATHVWKQGMPNWEVLGNVTELKAIADMIPPAFPNIK